MQVTRIPIVPLVILAVACASAVAVAGECDDEAVGYFVRDQEARARAAKPAESKRFDDEICLDDRVGAMPRETPKLAKRLLAACTKILDKLPSDPVCVDAAAYLGNEMVGAHDIVETLAARPNELGDARSNRLFAATRATRAAPIVIARWKQLEPIADQHAKSADWRNDWAAWRNAAAVALGATGDATAKQFLLEQLARPLDLGVKRRCREAIAAIEKRTATR